MIRVTTEAEGRAYRAYLDAREAQIRAEEALNVQRRRLVASGRERETE